MRLGFQRSGFAFKSSFVRVQLWLGMGSYSEFLLLGVRGKASFNAHDQRVWGELGRRRHSEKPCEIRELLSSVSPGPYLELFGRRIERGWTVWGDQILER